MLVLEFCQVVHVLVDNDVQIVGFVVGGHVGCRESLGHVDGSTSLLKVKSMMKVALVIQECLKGIRGSRNGIWERDQPGVMCAKGWHEDGEEAGLACEGLLFPRHMSMALIETPD
jgi:hypothetical protein